MAELKTKPTEQSVTDFLNAIPEAQKRQDSFAILELMRRVSGAEPKMWGESIVGFGTYHYRYASGREGDWPRVAFSPRKQNLTIYGMERLAAQPELAARLGKHKTGKGCLYINKLTDIDLSVLEELVRQAVTGE